MGDTKTDPEKLTEEVKTEAAEVTADIKETKEEAEAARQAGDTAKADRLETRVNGLETKLDGIAETLKGLAERPFHPAPEEKPAATPALEEKTTEETPAAEDKPKAKGRTYNRGWFGSRADSED